MKKYIFLIILSVFTIVSFLFLNDGYDFKIELEINDLKVSDIDKNIAKNFEDELLKIKNIRKLYLISSEYGCNIYIKLSYLPLNKSETYQKITNKVNYLSSNFKEIEKINFIDNYKLNYQFFIVLTNNNYDILKAQYNDVLEKLLSLKLFNDIKIYGLEQRANYIYFSSDDLVNYDLDIKNIKTLIRNENQTKNLIIKNTNFQFYPLNLNTNLKTIDDLKNIRINFKDKNFSAKFDDVFEFEEKLKYPSKTKVYYKNKRAIVFEISKKFPYPIWIIKKCLDNKNCDFDYLKIKKYKKIDLFLENNSNIEKTIDFCKKIQNETGNKDNLYFIAKNPHFSGEFDEVYKNKITIYTKKPKEILKKYKNFTKENNNKNMNIIYQIDNYNLNKYEISKEDLYDTIKTQNDGLICDYYWKNDEKIEIILKNKTSQGDIYSKKYKILIDKNQFIKEDFKKDYFYIIRTNSKTPLKT